MRLYACIFRQQIEARRLGGIDSRNLVEKIGEPHKFAVIGKIETHHGVVDGLVADVYFLQQRFFRKMQQCTADIEVLVDLILQVESKKRLALHGEHRLVLKRDTDVLTRVDDALVGDSDDTHGIVNGIVGVLGQTHAASHNHNRTAGNVQCIEPYLRARRRHILAFEDEFVFVGELSGHNNSGVVQLLIDITLGDGRVTYLLGEVAAERFRDRKNNLAGRCQNSIAFDIVEEAVGIALLIAVDTVEIHHLKKALVVQPGHGQIVDLSARSVGKILDVEPEFIALQLVSAHRIDVLHHQIPHGQLRRCCRSLQHFQIERLIGRCDVGRELAHLEHLTVVGIFVCNGKNLVGVYAALHRDIAESTVESILRRTEQSGALHFLIVLAALDAISRKRFEHLRDTVDVAGAGEVVLDDGKKVVGVVRRVRQSRIRSPVVAGKMTALAKVHESDKVACLLEASAFVRHPHFYTCDFDTGSDIGQARAKTVVVVAEEMTEKEVAVLLVLVGVDSELGSLCAALAAHRLRFRLLLRDKRCRRELAELQLCLQTEQRRASADERRPCCHRHVTGFYALYNIVLLAFV